MKALNGFLLLSMAGLAVWRSEATQQELGTLQLSVVDAASEKNTPARVEVLDPKGKGYVAEDAIPVGAD